MWEGFQAIVLDAQPTAGAALARVERDSDEQAVLAYTERLAARFDRWMIVSRVRRRRLDAGWQISLDFNLRMRMLSVGSESTLPSTRSGQQLMR